MGVVTSDKDPNTLKVIDFGVSRVQEQPRCGSNCFLLLNHGETYNVTALCYLIGFCIFILLALFRLPDYSRIQSPSIRRPTPEVTKGLLCTTAIDMWSFGCCVIELLIGRQASYGVEEIEPLTCTIEVTVY